RGAAYTTFKEFCETPEPWGLGEPETKIRAALEVSMGKAAAQLETVDEATPETSRNPDGKNQWKKVSGHDDLKPNRAISVSISNETAKRLRAITRAPSAIQDAYREGRISQTLAAKL